MTKQSRIGRTIDALPDTKGASLFERADAVFGLDALGPAAVPKDLPAPKLTAARVAAAPHHAMRAEQQFAPTKAMPQAPADTAASFRNADREERAVKLCGPRVEISRDLLRQANLIVPEEPVTGLLEEFRIVKRELLADARAANNAAARRILVCSPHPGEGKTYCATNLAIAMAAERDIEVVLIDADVINPSVTCRLGIEVGPGLMDAVSDASLKPEELVSPTDIAGLFIMSAGTGSTRDAEYLTSTRAAQVLDRLTMGAPNRFVIFDTPPALAASPAAELAAHVGQTLLVVRADETSRAALDDARQLLSACADIKLLLNAVQFSPSGRHFGDYGEREE